MAKQLKEKPSDLIYKRAEEINKNGAVSFGFWLPVNKDRAMILAILEYLDKDK